MWTLPDKGEGDHDLQSICFQEYLDVLVAGLTGKDCVLAGCEVTGGADMTPAVAAGVVRSDGVMFAVAAGDVAIGAADATDPRIDLIVVDSAGAKQVRAGTPAPYVEGTSTPKPPARSANDVVLAAVYVPANDTSIETTKITDLRVIRDYAPLGHIYELTMSNAADTVNDITVQAGEAADGGGTHLMPLPVAITKRLDAVWAVGTNAGGLNTGAKAANTWYEVHLIQRSDTGAVDVMFTTVANRATLPANYDRQRRIGWVRTDAVPGIRQFKQVGDYFTLVTALNDVAVNFTTTATLVTLTSPPNTLARIRASVTSNLSVNTAFSCILQEVVEAAAAPDDTVGMNSIGSFDAVGCNGGHFEMRVDVNSQIRHDEEGTTGTPTLDISTYGWIDRRSRLEDV